MEENLFEKGAGGTDALDGGSALTDLSGFGAEKGAGGDDELSVGGFGGLGQTIESADGDETFINGGPGTFIVDQNDGRDYHYVGGGSQTFVLDGPKDGVTLQKAGIDYSYFYGNTEIVIHDAPFQDAPTFQYLDGSPVQITEDGGLFF